MLLSTTTFTTLLVSLASLVTSSPLLQVRQDDTSSNDPRAILKPETLLLIDTVTEAITLPGGIITYVSPKGNGVITLGNRSTTGEPVTPDTHFAIASNSKLFLGTTLVILSEQNITLDNGQIWTLDTPLKDFVPGFKMVDEEATEQATTLDFLSHRTGLPPYNLAITNDASPRKNMEQVAFLRPNTPFRANFTYSNFNYAAITYVVELLTGKSYNEVLDELIFKPLDLDASSNFTQLVEDEGVYSQGWLRQGTNSTQCATDSAVAAGSNDTSLATLLPPSCAGDLVAIDFWTKGAGQEFGAGGNVIATGNDLVKWTKEILNPTHISPSVFERVETVTFSNAAGQGYAIGTVQADYRGYNISTHDGALPGSNSNFIRIRNESIGVFAVGTDDSYTSLWYTAVMNAIIDDLLDLPPVEAAGDDSAGPNDPADSASPLSAVPLPADPRPGPDSSTYIGKTFASPGFNNFTLSTLDLTDTQKANDLGIPLDFLFTDAATLLGIDYGSGVIYANWDQTIGEHLFFTHFDGPMYNVTVLSSWPAVGGGAPDFVGKFWGAPTAVITEKGIGFFEGFWGQQGVAGNVKAVEEGVEETAETFFVKR